MWTHKEAEQEAAKWHIEEIQDNLQDLKEARRAWPERKQGYEAGLEDNTRRINAAQGEIEAGHNQIQALIRGQVEAQEEEDQDQDQEEDNTQIWEELARSQKTDNGIRGKQKRTSPR